MTKLFNLKEASGLPTTNIQKEFCSISEIKSEKNNLLVVAYKLVRATGINYKTWFLDLENKTLIQSALQLRGVSFDDVTNDAYAVDNTNCIVKMSASGSGIYYQAVYNGSAWTLTTIIEAIAEKSYFFDADCMWTSIVMYGTGTINFYRITNDRAYPPVNTVSLSERGTEIGVNEIGTVFNVKFAMLDNGTQWTLKHYKIKYYPLNKGTTKHDTSGGVD